ncbi:hypothetical protein KAH94_01880 [bacterium]|nr:hypothetical protein [bacterium]
MVLKQKGLIYIILLLLLPACSDRSKKKSKKLSRSLQKKSGSIFTSISEDEIRDDVREYHELQKDGNNAVDEEKVKNSSVIVSDLFKKMSRKQKAVYVQERSQELEAKLNDIPFLMNAEPIVDFFQNVSVDSLHNIELGYKINMPMQKVVSFYQKGMECNGWQEVFSVLGFESLFYFKKPDRYCSISVRPYEKRKSSQPSSFQIVICVGKVV